MMEALSVEIGSRAMSGRFKEGGSRGMNTWIALISHTWLPMTPGQGFRVGWQICRPN